MKGLYIGIAVTAIVVSLIFFNKRKNIELEEEVVDEIEFDKITDFFKERVSLTNTSNKAIMLRIGKSDLKKYNLSYLSDKTGVILTFYDEESNSVDVSNSKVLISKNLDKQTMAAFGDREMVIFN